MAGTYYTHGVCAYNATDGVVLWHRKDLRKQDGLRQLTGEGGLGLVGIQFQQRSPKGEMILEAESMKTVRVLHGAEGVWTDSKGGLAVRRTKSDWQLGTLTNDLPVWTQPGPSSAGIWHTAAFGPDSIVVADGATARGYSLEGELLWSADLHLGQIAWHHELGAWVGLSHLPNERAAAVVIDANGKELARKHLPSWLPVLRLSSNGKYLIGCDGHILAVPDLSLVWQFAAPEDTGRGAPSPDR